MSPYELKDVLVRIDKVSLSYGDVQILRDVDAEVRDIVRPGCTQGQVVGILGPSGIGKTQLSRIMSGLQSPSSGRVLIGTKGEPVHSGLVGVVAQNYPLLRHRTVLGNLVVAARQSGLGAEAARDKAMEYLKRFELEARASYYPSQLSGGQRQRVAIIQQLLCSEHYLIMDEPFTGLDPIMKDKTCELVSQVASLHEENTIFIVAHDIAALVSVSDTLWLLGRDRDEKGAPVPGSRIQAKYDLIERGLAWNPGISSTPQFASFLVEVKERFRTL